MTRSDGRKSDELRPLAITRGFIKHAEGSVLFELGGTRVICTASIEDKVPHFLKDKGTGWLTAEYSMIPRATGTRKVRDAVVGRLDGRSQEIQRLIGRSLRSVVDLSKVGERTITIDCDVIQADGGTRTASITGGYICLVEALRYARSIGLLTTMPLIGNVAAISVGIVDGTPVLDLSYEEDFAADVDMNVVMNGEGELIEIQGTAEGRAFGRDVMNRMLDLAHSGVRELNARVREVLE
jgi:ribonuclease PH